MAQHPDDVEFHSIWNASSLRQPLDRHRNDNLQDRSPVALGAPIQKRIQKPDRQDEDAEPEAKRMRAELQSHLLYDEYAPKVIIVSSDGKRFCVDRHTLYTYR
jgi:hypothetical protein